MGGGGGEEDDDGDLEAEDRGRGGDGLVEEEDKGGGRLQIRRCDFHVSQCLIVL